MKSISETRMLVAAGLGPAVEPGVPPGGSVARNPETIGGFVSRWEFHAFYPGGKLPPAKAGGMPAAAISQ